MKRKACSLSTSKLIPEVEELPVAGFSFPAWIPSTQSGEGCGPGLSCIYETVTILSFQALLRNDRQ